jgi:hypothetical protein
MDQSPSSSGLKVILREATQMDRLSVIVKGLNTVELFQRLEELEVVLYRQKADVAVSNVSPDLQVQHR